MTGLTVGNRYVLDDQIGQGGMGVVWRGRDRVSGTAYAIKVLRPEYAGAGQNTAEVFCIMKAGGTGFCTDMPFRAIERS